MEDLLPFYERELGFLRRYGAEFAERYPKIANRLLISPEGSEDPHVERLIESFALLSARVSKKIDDDYPEFTRALLEVLYPHYLRPFPSCSIAHFDMGGALGKLGTPVTIPRGSILQTRAVKGVNCRFRTVYDIHLAPLRVAEARYLPIAEPPMTVQAPTGIGGQISMTFELVGDFPSVRALGIDRLRLFVDGEPSVRAALRDALAMGSVGAYFEPTGSGRWTRLPHMPLRQAGFAPEDAMIDFPEHSHAAYRLLTELFAFPEKFGFFDLMLGQLPDAPAIRFTLHLLLRSKAGDMVGDRLLQGIRAGHFKTGCSPIVNLFRMQGEPIRLTHHSERYPVVADFRRAHGYEVFSIDVVKRIRQTPNGEQVTEYRPFYSLYHGESPDKAGQYWIRHRDEDVARHSPGHETELSFVDLDFNPSLPQTDVVSVQLTCSNRDLPSQLAHGVAGGDLTIDGGSPARAIVLLRKPTASLPFPHGRGAQWRLISHLSLNTLSLTGAGLPALKEMLRLYDMSRSTVTARQIDGIVDMASTPSTLWLSGEKFGSLVRGIDIRLTIDEAGFVGAGIASFVGVLDRFFGLYVSINSFTRLCIVSGESGEVLIQCEPRSGESPLA